MRDAMYVRTYVLLCVSVTLQECQLGLERTCHASGMSIRTLARMRARTWIIRGSPGLCDRDVADA